MKTLHITPSSKIDLVIETIASDKSISHRCAMFSLLSDKPSRIKNFLRAEDTLNSLAIAQALGASVEDKEGVITVTPPKKLHEAPDVLDCGNAGTGMRLYTGLLAGIDGFFILTGDKYLRSRPMNRVCIPLGSIGAKLDGRDNGNLAPLSIRGAVLKKFDYVSPIASAQVKSAMILAALNGDGTSTYVEPELSRDHTERMLSGMGARVQTREGKVYIEPINTPLEPLDITVPADPSSGFFFAVACAITPGAKIVLKNISLNKTRIEAYHVLAKMGTKIDFVETENKYEPIGDIHIEYAPLHGVSVKENISWLIDELPALSVAMSQASGVSVVKNAEELRVKESDRISSVVDNLRLCGVTIEENKDGYEIVGDAILKEATINSYGDHRIAMSFAIAGLKCGMKVEDTSCIDTSFPNFVSILEKITKVEHGN